MTALSDDDLFAALTQVKVFTPMLAQALADHISTKAKERDALQARLAEAERERDRLRGYWQRVLRQSEDCEAIVFDYEELQRIMLECRTPDSAN